MISFRRDLVQRDSIIEYDVLNKRIDICLKGTRVRAILIDNSQIDYLYCIYLLCL